MICIIITYFGKNLTRKIQQNVASDVACVNISSLVLGMSRSEFSRCHKTRHRLQFCFSSSSSSSLFLELFRLTTVLFLIATWNSRDGSET